MRRTVHLHDIGGDLESFVARKGAEEQRRRNDPDPRTIRVWAAEQGIAISPRGRVPAELMDAYREAFGLERLVPLRDFTCEEGFRTDATLVDDVAFSGLSTLQVLNRIPDDYAGKLLVIVDEVRLAAPAGARRGPDRRARPVAAGRADADGIVAAL
ncbi:hypothetical protein ABH920_003750 [Catenulispora sp. EB89]|uniref:Lsr2 family DNA-binding protein n=1 Tax=Catenulispora sp. EB89 TaxID=3156257 RepID=UPI003515934F